jgi:hypothetical protein
MVVKLPASSTYTRRYKSNSHAKFIVIPHRRSAVLVKHPTQRLHWELGRARESIRKKFLLNIQAPSIAGRNQVVHTAERRNPALLYTMLECNQKLSRRCLRRKSNRRFFEWPSSFGPSGRNRENKAKDSV